MKDFCNRVMWKRYGEVKGLHVPLDIINDLCESGKAGRFVHYVENGSSQWDKLCALEDALVDHRKHNGFMFVVGERNNDIEVRGWMEYSDLIIVPFGPERQKKGMDVGVYDRSVFDSKPYTIHAMTPCSEDSAIHINKQVREITGKPINFNGTVG